MTIAELTKGKATRADFNEAGRFVNLSRANDAVQALQAELSKAQGQLLQLQTKHDNAAQVEAEAEKLKKENVELKEIVRTMADVGAALEKKLKAATAPRPELTGLNLVEASFKNQSNLTAPQPAPSQPKKLSGLQRVIAHFKAQSSKKQTAI